MLVLWKGDQTHVVNQANGQDGPLNVQGGKGKGGKQPAKESGGYASEDTEAERNRTIAAAVEAGLLPIVDTKLIKLKDEELICSKCGSKMVRNGSKHAYYTLIVVPARFAVIDNRAETAVCNHCSDVREDGKRTTRTAKHNKEAEKKLSGGYLSPALAAFLATMWIFFGITKYRMQIMTAGMGFPMNSSTMGDLLEKLRCWILPMYELLKAEALKAPVLFVDETTWRTMQQLKGGERKESRVFAYVTDPKAKGVKPIRIYEFQPDRKAEHITEFLDGYKYIIVTDGYQGYEKVEDVVHCICYAHVRRKFFDCLTKGAKKAYCTPRVGFDLCSYIITAEEYMEDQYGPLTPEDRVKYRHKISRPLVDKFFKWCESVKADKHANGKLMEAINYALNHQQLLSNYLDHGEAQPTSNHVERALRPIANFRKICMHTGNNDSTQLMMMLATLLQTAAINNLNPQEYLELYLTRMLDFGKDAPQEKVAELAPWSDEMQKAVKHLDLPVKKQKPWTESRFREARENLQETMEIAYVSSRTLKETTTVEEWFDFHWDEDVANPPRIRPDPPKKASKKEAKKPAKATGAA